MKTSDASATRSWRKRRQNSCSGERAAISLAGLDQPEAGLGSREHLGCARRPCQVDLTHRWVSRR